MCARQSCDASRACARAMLIMLEHPEQVEQTHKEAATIGFEPFQLIAVRPEQAEPAGALRLVGMADGGDE